jgi:hypothetical protein
MYVKEIILVLPCKSFKDFLHDTEKLWLTTLEDLIKTSNVFSEKILLPVIGVSKIA